jgi:hypothetical protein
MNSDISSARIALFAYNFPHKKTQDFIFHFLAAGLRPSIVVAIDYRNFNTTSSMLNFKPKHIDLLNPKEICHRFGLEYVVLDHNSDECCKLMEEMKIDLGVIAGARILDKKIIRVFPNGILNFHPGLLPRIRGLDSLLWSIYYNYPLGVSAHLIDENIDLGRLVKISSISEYPSDTLIELSLRLEQLQNRILVETVKSVINGFPNAFEPLIDTYPSNRKMPPELEAKIPVLLKKRLRVISQ